ncbi:hypothetical protein TELCIR_20364, partial [Teladorsagia circumcincta]
YNQLQTLPENVFMNSFLPRPNDRRVIYCCASIYGGGGISAIDRPYSTLPPVNLDLPPAHTLDDRPNNYFY